MNHAIHSIASSTSKSSAHTKKKSIHRKSKFYLLVLEFNRVGEQRRRDVADVGPWHRNDRRRRQLLENPILLRRLEAERRRRRRRHRWLRLHLHVPMAGVRRELIRRHRMGTGNRRKFDQKSDSLFISLFDLSFSFFCLIFSVCWIV